MAVLPPMPKFEFGYPPKVQPWFALWCPLLDCFLWVSYDLERLKKTQAVTMSKILTVLVELDSVLYKDNVIDNSCAVSWTLSCTETINFTSVLKKVTFDHMISSIEPSTVANCHEVVNAQKLFACVWKWITLTDINMPGICHQNICSALGIKPDDPIEQIYHILLTQNNPEIIDQKIQNLFADHE